MDNTEILSQLQQLLSWKKSKKFYCEKLNITEEYLEELLKELRKEETHETLEDLEKLETTKFEEDLKKGEAQLTFRSYEEIHNLDELIKCAKIDTDKWEITKYVQNYWGSDKNPHYQVKAWLSKKGPENYGLENFTKFLKDWEPSKFYKEVRSFPNLSEEKESVDVELNIADFHFAKKTIQKESPEVKTFDYYRTVADLVEKITSNYNIEKLVFPISNDFFHSDNYYNTTTNGTPQDVTMWYDEEYERGFEILATTISFLITQAKEVEVILVQGNHDVTKGFYVAHALEVFFTKSKVKFQRQHSRIKHTVLGNTFIGYHHGNHCKLDQLPILFATTPNMSLDFGKAKYREIHTGDKHHYLAKEITGSGVKIQQMPSLSGHDRWHVENGFVNQVRAALALVYHPEQGKIAEFEHRI